MQIGHIILLATFLVVFPISLAQADELSDVKQAIVDNNAKWTAGETSVSNLSQAERKVLCGGLPPESDEGKKSSNKDVLGSISLPRQFDWRAVNGKSFVTPVRNQDKQQPCGSCFIFAPVAALESQLIRSSISNQDVDLSEQIVLSCAGIGNCANGGNAANTSKFLQNTGTALESCYPYKSMDGSCGDACSGWRNNPYRMTGWSYANYEELMTSPETIKTAIYTKGPVVARMVVWSDFLNYKSGVYTHVYGESAGGHYVLIIGWDDDSATFIVKNSWGTDWGEAGCFRIMYSEMSSPYVRFGEWVLQYDGATNLQKSSVLSSIYSLLIGAF